MQICRKEITVVYFHPLFASHPSMSHPCPKHNDDYCVENVMPFHSNHSVFTNWGRGVKMGVGEGHCIIEND